LLICYISLQGDYDKNCLFIFKIFKKDVDEWVKQRPRHNFLQVQSNSNPENLAAYIPQASTA
jgi:hypothetical protein